jgi:hypothetical protein
MKKILFLFTMCFAFSCEEGKISDPNPYEGAAYNYGNEESDPENQKCYSHEHFKKMKESNSNFAEEVEKIERFTQNLVASKRNQLTNIVTIPVVFNVIYNGNAQNISQTQLQSQINVLNQDFGATNSDYGNTPSIFTSVRSGDTKIRFVLQNVVRKPSNKKSWRPDDSMKSSARGGIDPTNPATTLNIWVVNLSNNLLGYAQFPGGPLATDGVVLDDAATGNTGTAAAPFNKGRTATHEVGHWLNLRHIWGDATCGSDLVSDTPVHNASNGGCPAAGHLSTCAGTPVEMTMNYMDYTYDACMYMFSFGQSTRMAATLVPGGPRSAFNN